jgi:hypothetical protein
MRKLPGRPVLVCICLGGCAGSQTAAPTQPALLSFDTIASEITVVHERETDRVQASLGPRANSKD